MSVRIHLALRRPPLQRRLRTLLAPLRTSITAEAGEAAPLSSIDGLRTDLVLVHEDLLPRGPAELAERLRNLPGQPWPVLFTRIPDPAHRTELLGEGVRAVLGERDPDEALAAALAGLVRARARELAPARVRPEEDAPFVASSKPMVALLATVDKLVESDATVLLEGETGTGKERIAERLHRRGPRRDGPFVALNCAALPPSLIESELFGHERGAFTDAVRGQRGRFEQAHGGTLFLDEVGELPMPLQAKLLRVLQERRVQRLGAESTTEVDVRVVAATNSDLRRMIEEKAFRADLYYRIAVVRLAVPPLRDRTDDIEELARSWVERLGRRGGKGALEIAPEVFESLRAYSWPGNVRELVNVLERAVILVENGRIGLDDLPEEVAQAPSGAVPNGDVNPPGLSVIRDPFDELSDMPWAAARTRLLRNFERWYLERVMQEVGGRVGLAASRMQINPRSLYDMIRRHGLDRRSFRA